MHSLTTRARADHYRRQQLRQAPASARTSYGPRYRTVIHLLRWGVALLALSTAAAALWPDGRTHSLSLEPAPKSSIHQPAQLATVRANND